MNRMILPENIKHILTLNRHDKYVFSTKMGRVFGESLRKLVKMSEYLLAKRDIEAVLEEMQKARKHLQQLNRQLISSEQPVF